MPFAWLEDAVTSDVTFHAWGPTLDAAFAAAVDATTAAMVADLDAVRAVERRSNQIHLKATPQEPQQVQHAQGSPTLPVGGRRRSQKQETLRHGLPAFSFPLIGINPPT